MTCLLLALRLFHSSALCNFQAPGVNWKEQILCCIQTWLNVADRGTVWKSVPDPGPDPVIASSLFQAPDREGHIHHLSADFYLATFWRHLFIPRAYWGGRLFLKSLFWVSKKSCLVCPREAGCEKQTLTERSIKKLLLSKSHWIGELLVFPD